MLAIEDYEMIHETVNKALKLVKKANSTLVNITEEVSYVCGCLKCLNRRPAFFCGFLNY